MPVINDGKTSMMKSTLTLFTSPKPFVDEHISIIQQNALRSWVELGKEVQVVLLGDEEGVGQIAQELGVTYLPEVARNHSGTPLLSDMFRQAAAQNDSPLIAFVNADILLLPDFLAGAKRMLELTDYFLAVGQRWDLDIAQPLDFSAGWQQRLVSDCDRRGKLHKPMGSDYFIYPRQCFSQIPDFAIGRSGWDNWMLYEARQRGWKLIDATASIRIIHQNHDYSHLPGNRPHYHTPESEENVRLAGGRRHIFLLQDVNWFFRADRLVKAQKTGSDFWREVEIFPLVALHSEGLAKFFYFMFHPRKAYNEWRKSMREKGK
jgi:hypothetical protein